MLAAYSSTTNKIADYSYTAWGETQTANETSSFTNNPLRYCGEYYDYESGMTYLRARYYDSEIKRFISEDPIRDGANWYVYAGNNPVMFVDPLGLAEVILKYIVEKNGGSVTWHGDGVVSIKMPGYKEIYAEGYITDTGRTIVDSEWLQKNFALSEYKTEHHAGDLFENSDDAALAFGLMYYDVSRNEQQEYAAAINVKYSRTGEGYYYANVTNSSMTSGKSVDELTDKERREVLIIRDENSVADIHTHWRDNGKHDFSDGDPGASFEYSNVSRIYLVNSKRELLKLYRKDYESIGRRYGTKVTDF